MLYMRGQARDYDHWRQLGLAGWGWDDVLPFFKRHEDHCLGPSDAHGTGGECRVERQRVRWDLLDTFRQAAAEAGIRPIDDFNGGDNEGSAPYHVTQVRGRRWSAARGFLKPVLHRPNLRLETGCLVEAVEFEGRTATGVRWRQDGAVRRARCRGEVILAAGAIGSPQILMLSGVGPAAQLREHGVPVVLDRAGVGENLHDHLQVRLIYKVSGVKTLNELYHSLWGRAAIYANYAFLRRGPLTMAPSQLGLFTRSDPSRDRANLQFHIQALSFDRWGEPLHTFPACTVSVCNVQPTSRGFVRLASGDSRARRRPSSPTTWRPTTTAGSWSMRSAPRAGSCGRRRCSAIRRRKSCRAIRRRTTMRRCSRLRPGSARPSSIRWAPPRWDGWRTRVRSSTNGCG